MKGFVLAAGFGSRMAPLTQVVPKPLLPVGNIPLIGYALRLLAHHGITDVAVNLHHLGSQLEDALGDGSRFGVELIFSEEDEILGTGGGLKKMQSFLTDTFVVVNADTIIDLDLQAVIDNHSQSGALATMVLREDARQNEFGLIEIDTDNRIQRLLGQGEAKAPLRPLMFAGVHILEPRFLDYIPAGVNTCVNRYGYTKALSNKEHLNGAVTDGYWADFGTPTRYLQGNFDALDQRLKLSYADPLSGFALAPKKDVADVVRMGEGVQLGSNVRLVPPVVLGDGVRVGENATVGPYVVAQAKVNIGKEAMVSESVLTDGAKIDNNVVVRRAIVGRKVTVQVDEPSEPRATDPETDTEPVDD